MEDRKKLIQALVDEGTTQTEQAIALLWLYNVKQEYAERTTIELAHDFDDEGFSKPNVSRLTRALRKDKKTLRGRGEKSFKINPRFFTKLTERYAPIVDYVQSDASSSVIPLDFVLGTKIHIEQLVRQINGCYDRGFYDAASVILRRLLEFLIIETYIHNKQVSKIKNGTAFKMLDGLISIITNDPGIILSRDAVKNIQIIKDIGDTAAHNRSYITPREDIDDNKQKIRRIISEMLHLSGIKK